MIDGEDAVAKSYMMLEVLLYKKFFYLKIETTSDAINVQYLKTDITF